MGLANHTACARPTAHLIPIEDSAAPIRDEHGKADRCGPRVSRCDDWNARQELLRKSEKLAAAARLSATVAHEINNPLEAVGNLIYLAR